MMSILKKLDRTSLIILSCVTGGVALFLIVVSVYFSAPSMLPLYSNLSKDDLSEVIMFLNRYGHKYSVKGTDIYAPDNRIKELRMQMAAEGIPNSGSVVGYEIFNKSDIFSSSSFNQNVNLIRALEGELSRTITSFDAVKSARVHLVLPKKELFAKERNSASASALLSFNRGRENLTSREVGAISHLIASAVPGLTPANVTIIDTEGRSLKIASDENEGFSVHLQDYKFNTERRLRETIESMVERYVGIGKVRAEISAEINFDKEVINIEKFDPDGRVMRSQHINEEINESGGGAGGAVGVSTNIPNGGAQSGGGGGGASSSKIDEVKNYEISKEVRNSVREVGNIKKLSIGVLVDGIYKKGEDGALSYQPRDDAEIAKLKSLISSAVGLDKSRGDVIEVVNMQFSDNSLETEDSSYFLATTMHYLPSIINNMVSYLVLFLIAIFVIRPLINRGFDFLKEKGDVSELKTESQEGGVNIDIDDSSVSVEEMSNISSSEGESDSSVEGNSGQEDISEGEYTIINRVNDLVKDKPKDTLDILRGWMYGRS